MTVAISPSILSADFSMLGFTLAKLEEAGADRIHLDVMDGHFVPNLTFGPPVIGALRSHTKLPFEAHLMIDNPDFFLDAFIKAGVDEILVHPRTCPDLLKTLTHIKSAGKRCGLVINPKESADIVTPYLHMIDQILVMTVEPGFGGQSFMHDQLPKITKVKEMIGSRTISLSVDGGVTSETAPLCISAGATILVAGSSVFKNNHWDQNIQELKIFK